MHTYVCCIDIYICMYMGRGTFTVDAWWVNGYENGFDVGQKAEREVPVQCYSIKA